MPRAKKENTDIHHLNKSDPPHYKFEKKVESHKNEKQCKLLSISFSSGVFNFKNSKTQKPFDLYINRVL